MTDDDFAEAFEQLPPDMRADLLAMREDFQSGPFGKAFWELAELVGEEEAKAYLMKSLMGGPVH